MKRVVLINTYSDRNKGDLGIILGTINVVKAKFPNIIINAISSFSSADPWYNSEHLELEKYINKMYPNIIGRVYLKCFLGRVYLVLKDLIIAFIIEYFPFFLLDFGLRLFYRDTINVIRNADLVISKGGSFLCNKDNIIDKIRLRREIVIFTICLRYKKKVAVWGQSIGPIYGRKDILRVRRALRSVNLIVVREELCLSKYSYIFEGLRNIVKGHDLAFNLPLSKDLKRNNVILFKGKCDVALTLKNYNNIAKNKVYFKILKDVLCYLNDNYDCMFHFVPHVTIDDDFNQVENFVSFISGSIPRDNIIVDINDYSIDDLLDLYESKDLLIGSRLHSTIFALTRNTRVINIGYHGTKAKGVFDDIGLRGCQFDLDDDIEKIIPQINYLFSVEFDFSRSLKKIREENIGIFNSL